MYVGFHGFSVPGNSRSTVLLVIVRYIMKLSVLQSTVSSRNMRTCYGFLFCAACLYANRLGCSIPMLFKKSHTNRNEVHNGNSVSRLKFYVLSNGAFVFGVSLILCTGKCMKPFTEAVLAPPKLYFQHIGLYLQGEKSVPFEIT
jgi:hypothetical protein